MVGWHHRLDGESWPQRLELIGVAGSALQDGLQNNTCRAWCRERQYLPCRQEELQNFCSVVEMPNSCYLQQDVPDFPYIKTHLCHLKKQLSMWIYFLTCNTFLLLREQFCFTVNLVFLDLYLMQGLVLHGFHVFLSFIGNFAYRWGNSGNSVRLYFWGLQNHCRW